MIHQLHKNIYIPPVILKESALFQKNIKKFDISQHLIEHCLCTNNRSHSYDSEQLMKCLDSIKEKPRRPFEIQIRSDYKIFKDFDWHITKICVRLPVLVEGQTYTDDLSVALGFKYKTEEQEYDWDRVVVITAWLNDKDDHHSTLRETEYLNADTWVKLCEQQFKKQQYYKYQF